jgi:hypothetical protein
MRPDRFRVVRPGRGCVPPLRCIWFLFAHIVGAGGRDLVEPVPGPYSVLLNSAIATDIITRPITATRPRDSHIGTAQPAHVMAGVR